MNILLTGVGAPGTKGSIFSLRNNFDDRKVKIIGVDLDFEAIGKYLCDNFYSVNKPDDEGYLDHIIDICKHENIDIILPQTTREVAFFSEVKTLLKKYNIACLCSNSQSLSTANSKSSLLDIVSSLDLPYPRYFKPKNNLELKKAVIDLGYPQKKVVVKLSVSNGMRGLRILSPESWDFVRFKNEKPSGIETTLDDFLKIVKSTDIFPDLLVTEYLSGLEYSVDVFRNSEISVVIPRSRDVIRSGISFENTVIKHDGIIDQTKLISDAIGLTGVFGFQYKLDNDGVPKILECNPRIQGTMVASHFAGVNVIWLGVKAELGEKLPVSIEPKYGAKFKRYWGGIGNYASGQFQEI